MEKKIRVVHVEPNQPAKVVEIENTLKNQQALVGGLIQPVDLPDETTLVCNEEYLLLGLPDNRVVRPWGMIQGSFFICDVDEDGYFASLPEKYIEKYLKIYS